MLPSLQKHNIPYIIQDALFRTIVDKALLLQIEATVMVTIAF
jgi:hypothetical protein